MNFYLIFIMQWIKVVNILTNSHSNNKKLKKIDNIIISVKF